MKIRIKDIAEKAGVSVGTVDRVLHNRKEVSEETKSKVMSILKEMNYTPDMLARALAMKKKISIAILLPETTSSSAYWAFPKKGIEKAIDELSHLGIRVKYFYFDLFNSSSFVKMANEAINADVNAILTAPVFKNETLEFIHNCNTLNMPYVFIDSNIDEAKPLSFIGQSALHSGQVAAKLMSMGLDNDSQVLIMTIAKQRDNIIHFTQRIEGFRNYMKMNKNNKKILIRDVFITEAEDNTINCTLEEALISNVKGIFVPNSRVYKVADYIASKQIQGVKLIGYDLLEKNINFMKKGVIDFLISQRSEEQGYRAIQALFNYFIFNKKPEAVQYLPIDILTSENIDFY